MKIIEICHTACATSLAAPAGGLNKAAPAAVPEW